MAYNKYSYGKADVTYGGCFIIIASISLIAGIILSYVAFDSLFLRLSSIVALIWFTPIVVDRLVPYKHSKSLE